MSFAKAYSGANAPRARALVSWRPAASALAGCDTLSSLNPFDKSENYKPEIVAGRSGRQALQ